MATRRVYYRYRRTKFGRFILAMRRHCRRIIMQTERDCEVTVKCPDPQKSFVQKRLTQKDINLPSARLALERSRESQQKVRIFYGNRETGRDWLEEFDTVGVICPCSSTYVLDTGKGRPINVAVESVVRIVNLTHGYELYRHPNYHVPALRLVENKTNPQTIVFEVEACKPTGDYELHARFNHPLNAYKYLSYLRGEVASWE